MPTGPKGEKRPADVITIGTRNQIGGEQIVHRDDATGAWILARTLEESGDRVTVMDETGRVLDLPELRDRAMKENS